MGEKEPSKSHELAKKEETEEDLTQAQAERLLPPAIDLFSSVDWDRAPKMLAIALATHQVIDENIDQIRELALEHLQLRRRKKKVIGK